MWFNSFAFLVFAPLALGVHALLRGRAARLWLVFASYVFYGWAIPWCCLLLFASTLLDYTVALRLSAAATPRRRRLWLAASLAGNLGLLGVFKYLGFFAGLLNVYLGLLGAGALAAPDIVLPIGISFYTFQTLSYTIDVYRGRLEPTRDFTAVALYVAFFPQLVAGPIERAGHLLPQLAREPRRDREDFYCGVSRILWGLTKKVVFADWLGVVVAKVYAAETLDRWTGPDLALATVAFAFQIYLDFSAYSDIAIGLARLLGVRLRENFRWPYLARNIGEFWRRWHISLSTWLRDYLYLSLGGSRRGAARTALNVLLVMVLGGLWHGADARFVLWGLWIGLGLALYHAWANLTGRRPDEDRPFAWRQLPGILATFLFMLVSWVFFRAESAGHAFALFGRLAAAWGEFRLPVELAWRSLAFIALAGAAHVARGLGLTARLERARHPLVVGAFWGLLIALMALAFAPARERFIYFQF